MFKNARIKLTAWYLLIITVISLSFSLVIFQMISVEIDRFTRVQYFRFERQLDIFPPRDNVFFDPDLINETKRRLALTLVFINGGILIFAGTFGYLLAGRTLKPIREMLDEQNRFISDASHEFRTPLTSLKSAFEVNLRDRQITLRGAKKLITESIEEVNKLQSLSDGLLKLTQYQKLNSVAKFEKVSLSEIVRDAVNKLSYQSQQKNIAILSRLKPVKIMGVKASLVDLLVILLDNAVKYSPENKKIMITSKIVGNQIVISVKDEGTGISPKDLPHIFDRFYRADTARTKTQTGGYGLGLSIAKKIVENHHGSITVTSREKIGSTFNISLPFSPKT